MERSSQPIKVNKAPIAATLLRAKGFECGICFQSWTQNRDKSIGSGMFGSHYLEKLELVFHVRLPSG